MSIKSFDAALDFFPAAATGRPGPLRAVTTFFSAIADGLAAEADYRRHLARGLGHSEAAARAFDQNFKNR